MCKFRDGNHLPFNRSMPCRQAIQHHFCVHGRRLRDVCNVDGSDVKHGNPAF